MSLVKMNHITTNYLSLEKLNQLIDSLVQAGLCTVPARDDLLGGINKGYVASLPMKSNALDQIRSDLTEMNSVPFLHDRQVPLLIWLSNVVDRLKSGARPEQELFQKTLDEVAINNKARSGLGEQPPTLLKKFPSGIDRITRPETLLGRCDRTEQITRFFESLDNHRRERSKRPFVCLIHGSVLEHPEYVYTRFRDEILPGELKSKPQEYKLLCPDANQLADPSRAWMEASIEDQDGRLLPLHRAAEMVASVPVPVLFDLRLSSQRLVHSGGSALNAFFKLWDGWNDLLDGQTLLVCVSLRYEITHSQSMFRWLKVWSTHERRKLEEHNRRLKNHTEKLLPSMGSQNFSLAIIPELDSVPYDEAYTWAQYYWSAAEIERLYQGKDRLPFSLIVSQYEQHASRRHDTTRKKR